ncbi:MAG: hypothetical protein QQN41_00175 [Nitrosopumilus sp.]
MDIKNMIQELEEEKNNLDLKIIKIVSIIKDLENFDEEVTDSHPQAPKEKKKKSKGGQAKYPEEMIDFVRERMADMKNPELSEEVNKKFKLEVTPTRLASYMNYNDLSRKDIKKKPEPKEVTKEVDFNSQPERTQAGKIMSKKKKLFPDEVNEFIEKKWKANKDSELRQLIGEKFNRFYDIDQIQAHRRMIGCVSKEPGSKENPEKIKKQNPGGWTGDKRNRTHLCEECHENIWDSWDKGRQLCKKCVDSKEEKPQETKKSIEKLQEKYESDDDDMEDALEDDE